MHGLAPDRNIVIETRILSAPKCDRCQAMEQALVAERERNAVLEARAAELEADCTRLSPQLVEAMKLIELQQADLDVQT